MRPFLRRRPTLEPLEDRFLPTVLNPLPGTPDGAAGSLRVAIIAANSNGQDDVIQLQAGLYSLTVGNQNGHENGALRGDLGVTEAGHVLTIQGVDASATFIDVNNIDRAFQVLPSVTLVLRNLTIINGYAKDDGTSGALPYKTDSRGGAILNSGGSVTLDHVRLENNYAAGTSFIPPPGTAATNGLGGAIYSDGTMNLLNSVVANNFALGGLGGDGQPAAASVGNPGLPGGFANGGGLYLANGTVTIRDSTLSGNSAYGGNGGNGSAGGTFFGTAFAGGAGGSGATGAGAGLYLAGGTATLSHSTVSGNFAVGGQGGIGGAGANNNGGTAGAGGIGGAGGTGIGGGLTVVGGTLTLSDATIASNQARDRNGGQGGAAGMGAPNGTSGAGGAGGTAKGGGLFVFLFGTAEVHNSTVALNFAADSQGGPAGAGAGGMIGPGAKGQGGGVRIDNGNLDAVNAVSSIFAGNNASTDPDFSGNFNTAQNNLLANNTGSNLPSNPPNGNLVGTGVQPIDPRLLPLDFYGGPTQTFALRPDSPAIDAGLNPDNLTTDQRGFASRTVKGTADIGAFEFGALDVSGSSGGGGGTGGTGGQGPAVPGMYHTLVTHLTKVKGRTRIDVFDAATGAYKGHVFPFGKFHGKIKVMQADFNGDGFADLIVLGVQSGQLRQRIYSGVDLSILG
jgi:hypothetical protein